MMSLFKFMLIKHKPFPFRSSDLVRLSSLNSYIHKVQNWMHWFPPGSYQAMFDGLASSFDLSGHLQFMHRLFMLVLTAPVWPAAPPPWQQAGPAAQLTAPAGRRAARAVQQAPPPPSSSPFPHLGDSSLPSSDALDTKNQISLDVTDTSYSILKQQNEIVDIRVVILF